MGIEYFRGCWERREAGCWDDGAPEAAHQWRQVVRSALSGPFSEVYGPDARGDFVVVERASNFMAVFRHPSAKGLDVPSWRAFRTHCFYEEILWFVQSRAASMCSEPGKQCCLPRVWYVLEVDVSMDFSVLRMFYATFGFWKAIALLGDEYPGLALGTIFYGGDRIFRTALGACLKFSTSRDIHVVNSSARLARILNSEVPEAEVSIGHDSLGFLPGPLGGKCQAPVHRLDWLHDK